MLIEYEPESTHVQGRTSWFTPTPGHTVLALSRHRRSAHDQQDRIEIDFI